MMTRRRFLTVSAAFLSGPAHSATLQEWSGPALGTSGRILLSGASPLVARQVFAKVERTLRQVESQFSLYRESSLVRLNRTGWLAYPDPEMLQVFELADVVHSVTGGIFDPSIQPLWLATSSGGDVAQAQGLIGWHRVRLTPSEIRLGYRMQLTFNGIAQGYAADRIAALMRAEGFGDVLIDMGEIVGLGHRPTGGAWRADIVLPNGIHVATSTLSDRALATSSPAGTLIGGGKPHILNPSGQPPLWQLAAVSAPQAAVADALSTAFCLMDRPAIDKALIDFPQARLEALV